jgi:hypothetical protein
MSCRKYANGLLLVTDAILVYVHRCDYGHAITHIGVNKGTGVHKINPSWFNYRAANFFNAKPSKTSPTAAPG